MLVFVCTQPSPQKTNKIRLYTELYVYMFVMLVNRLLRGYTYSNQNMYGYLWAFVASLPGLQTYFGIPVQKWARKPGRQSHLPMSCSLQSHEYRQSKPQTVHCGSRVVNTNDIDMCRPGNVCITTQVAPAR